MKKIRVITFLLAALMLLGTFTSCTGNDTNTPSGNDVTDGGDTTTGTVSEETKYLEDITFPDQKINLLYWEGTENDEFNIEKTTGNPINDAIYARDLRVQDQLGVEIIWSSTPGKKGNLKEYKQHVENNIDSLNIIAAHSMVMGAVAADGLCRNLNDAKYFNWDQPWWPSALIEGATINDVMYFCSGDISNNTLLAMEAMFYNKNLTETNLYAYVDSKEWTIDKMIQESENYYDDSTGTKQGDKDDGDTYGFATYSGMINAMFVGMGIRITDSSSGSLKLSDTYVSEKTEGILEKLNGLFHTDNDWYYAENFAKSANIFKENRSLFYMASVRLALNTIADASDLKYGVLPTPMYDNKQTSYHTLSANTYSLYGVAKTVDDDTLDMCSALLELLAYDSYKNVTPIVFEATLKSRYSDDDNDSRMFDILRETLITEIGLIYSDDINGGFPSKGLFTLVDNDISNWLTFVQGKLDIINGDIAKINSSFKK